MNENLNIYTTRQKYEFKVEFDMNEFELSNKEKLFYENLTNTNW